MLEELIGLGPHTIWSLQPHVVECWRWSKPPLAAATYHPFVKLGGTLILHLTLRLASTSTTGESLV